RVPREGARRRPGSEATTASCFRLEHAAWYRPGVRYGIALPNYGALAEPATLAQLARRAEALGVDSIWVSDHLLAPTSVRSIYPYDRRPDAKPGDMGVIEHFYEPLTTLAD